MDSFYQVIPIAQSLLLTVYSFERTCNAPPLDFTIQTVGERFPQIPRDHRYIVLRLLHYLLEPWPRFLQNQRSGLAFSANILW